MAPIAESRARARKSVEAIFERYFRIAEQTKFNGFDKSTMSDLKLLDAGPEGSVIFEFTVTDSYTNQNGVMHGGAAGVLFDMGTTTALGPLAKPGYWDFLGGVTRTLNISYLKAIPAGTKIHIRSQVQQCGRTMALISGKMTSPDGKIVYCTCEHHKVNVPTRPEHLDVAIEWDKQWKKEDNKKAVAKL